MSKVFVVVREFDDRPPAVNVYASWPSAEEFARGPGARVYEVPLEGVTEYFIRRLASEHPDHLHVS